MRSCDILKICLHSARRHDTVERQAVPATPSYGTLSTRYFPSWQVEAIAREVPTKKWTPISYTHCCSNSHSNGDEAGKIRHGAPNDQVERRAIPATLSCGTLSSCRLLP